jgi:hypothetical protein
MFSSGTNSGIVRAIASERSRKDMRLAPKSMTIMVSPRNGWTPIGISYSFGPWPSVPIRSRVPAGRSTRHSAFSVWSVTSRRPSASSAMPRMRVNGSASRIAAGRTSWIAASCASAGDVTVATATAQDANVASFAIVREPFGRQSKQRSRRGTLIAVPAAAVCATHRPPALRPSTPHAPRQPLPQRRTRSRAAV